MKTFPIGGVHPSDNKKWSKAKAIETMELPDVVNIPLAQHIGAPATALVKKGDAVKVGDKIAEATGFMSANIHAPISGTVTAVDLQPNGQGLRQMMISIKREGDEWAEGIDLSTELVKECNLSAGEIIARIKECGIVGMGGATFPTHVKLSIPEGKKAEEYLSSFLNIPEGCTVECVIALGYSDFEPKPLPEWDSESCIVWHTKE